MQSERDYFQEAAEQVIKPLIPADAEQRVSRSLRQWNQIIREHIRNETGLKLADGESRFAIPVHVVKGFSKQLAQLIGLQNDPLLWRLIIGQPKLGGVVEGLQFLLDEWPAFETWPNLPVVAKASGSSLTRTRDVVVALQKAALAANLREQIKSINEDILGVYRFGGMHGSSVELFWMPIAMVAAMVDVRIEDLTLVVLAHELTHGYTHIGRDIDGTKWDDTAFRKSEASVVEGLAQFYTQVVTGRLASRVPGAKAAYDGLLTLQDGPYVVHQKWLEGEPLQRGETVRFAMISARSRGAIKYEDWESLLAETSARLKVQSAGPLPNSSPKT